MKLNKNHSGFTLIEIIIVVAMIGFLSAIAIPQFQNLSGQAQQNATKAGLGTLRSTLVLRYAASATGGANATFPASLVSTDFAANTPPYNALNSTSGVTALSQTVGGTATNAGAGFWYITSASSDYGKAGAYSNGTVNTSTW